MKVKYMICASVALLLASCDLDKEMQGQYVSDDQKEDVIANRPNLITAEVNAMAAKLNIFGTISPQEDPDHNDYGVAAVSLFLEQGGQDMPSTTSG